MNLPYARQADDLNKIKKFYKEIIGLDKLGNVENHENYNGLFLPPVSTLIFFRIV